MKGIRLEDRSRKTRVVGGASVCSSRKARPRGCVGAARFPKAERPGALICDVAGRRYCDEPPGDSGLGTRDSGLGTRERGGLSGPRLLVRPAPRVPGTGVGLLVRFGERERRRKMATSICFWPGPGPLLFLALNVFVRSSQYPPDEQGKHANKGNSCTL